MKPKLKAAWIEALLSGEYKQGKGNLQKDNKFCCLGVLCDIKKVKFKKEEGVTYYKFKDSLEGYVFMDFEMIPDGFCGIDSDSSETLAELNDGNAYAGTKKKSFKQIAKWIEKNL